MAPTITSTTSSSSKVNAAWSTFGRVTDIGIQAFPTGLPIRALAVESEGLFGTRPVAVQVRPVPGVQRYAALEVGPVPEGPETFIGRRRVESRRMVSNAPLSIFTWVSAVCAFALSA